MPLEPDLPAETAAWLVRPEGLAAVEEAHRLLADGHEDLAVAQRMRGSVPAEHAPAVVSAAVARRIALARGYPDGGRTLLTRTALEQASRPEVSRWRARRFADADAIVDLCCGVGLDTMALAAAAPVARAVDLDPSRVVLARHNLAGHRVAEVHHADALAPGHVAAGVHVHADPSRRDGGRRARHLGDYGPPLGALLDAVADAPGAGIAISPAVDWADPDLPADAEVEFVQVGSDLVEATLWTGSLRRAAASATLLPEGLTRSRGPRTGEAPVGPVGAYLVEVAPAAVRARVHDDIAAELDARRIDRGRALLTTDEDPGDGPWWRRWQVEEVLSARPRVLRRWLADAEELPLAISLHGIDASVEDWWRALGHVARGPVGRRAHLVRTVDGGRCIVTRDVDPDGPPDLP